MTEIVAECGVNWRTKEEAFEMIKQSKLAGASHSKFQIFNEETIKDSPLKKELTPLILTIEDVQELYEYGKEIGQSVFFTPMFLGAVDWCEEIGVELYKIRFADCYNYDLVYKVLAAHKEVLMSIDTDYRAMEFRHNSRIKFLYVVPKYPASEKDYNFDASTFQYFSGISDHTIGLEVAKKAISLGAKVVEKHCMLSGTHPVEEKWSISFDKLKELNPHNHPISPEKMKKGEGEKGETNVVKK